MRPRDGGNRVLDEAGLVQRVGVNRHLHVELVGHRQARVDRRRRRAPVLVQLQADRAGANLLAQRLGVELLPLPRKPKFSGNASTASYIRRRFQRARRARRRVRAGRRSGAAADERRHAGVERVGNLVRRDEVHVRVDAAGGEDLPLAGEDLGRRADLEAGRDAVHDARSCRPCRSRRCGRRECRRRPCRCRCCR